MSKKILYFFTLLAMFCVFISSCGTGTNTKTDENALRFRVKQDGTYGYINEKGEIIISPTYDHANYFSEGYAFVELGKKQFYINSEGDIAIIPNLENAEYYNFSEGLAEVCIDSFNCGYINIKGELVIPTNYYPAEPFSEGLAAVKTSDGYGYIDKTGKFAISPQYYDATNFVGGLAAVRGQDGKVKYIDPTGKVVFQLPDNYCFGFPFIENLALVSDCDRKSGFIDKSGNLVTRLEYYAATSFQEGLAGVEITEGIVGAYSGDDSVYNHVCGYIDNLGKLVIPARFEKCNEFSEGLASVTIMKNGNWISGYIDKTGNWIVQPQFDKAYSFRSGLAEVNNGYINTQGIYVWKNK